MDLHGLFGADEEGSAIKVRFEVDAFGGDFIERAQGENLVAAGIGEDGTVPGGEAMETAELADDFGAGAEIEVVGIPEDDLRAELGELIRVDGFYGALRADGHEDGRLDFAVGKIERAAAGSGIRTGGVEGEHA